MTAEAEHDSQARREALALMGAAVTAMHALRATTTELAHRLETGLDGLEHHGGACWELAPEPTVALVREMVRHAAEATLTAARPLEALAAGRMPEMLEAPEVVAANDHTEETPDGP